MTISSAWSITASVNPPRTLFVNYPLGHTAGRPHELDEQTAIVSSALDLVTTADRPGRIVPLDLAWPASWKTKARGRGDNRTERRDTPQWQLPADEIAVRPQVTADAPS